MGKTRQISAYISEETKEQLDRFVQATGMKKGFFIEEAIRNQLRALRELPAEFAIPARVVLTPNSFQKVVDAMKDASPPTPLLRKLMKGEPVENDGLD